MEGEGTRTRGSPGPTLGPPSARPGQVPSVQAGEAPRPAPTVNATPVGLGPPSPGTLLRPLHFPKDKHRERRQHLSESEGVKGSRLTCTDRGRPPSSSICAHPPATTPSSRPLSTQLPCGLPRGVSSPSVYPAGTTNPAQPHLSVVPTVG